MTQHTQNLLFGIVIGWALRGLVQPLYKKVNRYFRNKRLAKQSKKFQEFLDNTEEGQAIKKQMEEDAEFDLEMLDKHSKNFL